MAIAEPGRQEVACSEAYLELKRARDAVEELLRKPMTPEERRALFALYRCLAGEVDRLLVDQLAEAGADYAPLTDEMKALVGRLDEEVARVEELKQRIAGITQAVETLTRVLAKLARAGL